MKCLICSPRTKRPNSLKWFVQWWKLKVNLNKVPPPRCTVSSSKNVKRTFTSSWLSVQLVTTSVPECVCSLHWLTAVLLTGSKTGHKTLFCGWHVSSSTRLIWNNLFARNASRWCNTIIPQRPNGQKCSSTNWNVTTMSPLPHTFNWSQLSRNSWIKSENRSNQTSSSTKTDTKRSSWQKSQLKAWKPTWSISSPNLSKQP